MNWIALFLTGCGLVAGASAEPRRTSEIAGRVIDAETGDGIARARVKVNIRLVAPEPGAEAETAVEAMLTTADDGTFTLRNVPASWVTMWADKAGYLGSRCWPPIPEQTAQAQLNLPGPNEVSPVTLTLLRQAAVTGRVRDDGGAGVATVRLFRHTAAGVELKEKLEVDRTGEFRFALLPPGRYHLEAATASTANRAWIANLPIYAVSHFGGASENGRLQPFDLAPGKTMQVEMELRRVQPREIRGRVAGCEKLLTVLLSDAVTSMPAGDPRVEAETRTFTIHNVPPGDFRVEAVCESRGQRVRGTETVAVVKSDVEGLVVTVTKGER